MSPEEYSSLCVKLDRMDDNNDKNFQRLHGRISGVQNEFQNRRLICEGRLSKIETRQNGTSQVLAKNPRLNTAIKLTGKGLGGAVIATAIGVCLIIQAVRNPEPHIEILWHFIG